jgi:hypothetical protein
MKHTPSLLRLLVRYEPETGKLYWLTRPRIFFRDDREHKRWNTRYAGTEAFSLKASGYYEGMVFRTPYRAHRVAWAVHYGEWPEHDIDHIDGNPANNKLDNLRAVTRAENCRNTAIHKNNTSGALGVAKHGDRWKAYIRVDGRNIHLGVFGTLDEARASRKAAEGRYGYHPNHGRAA